MHGKAFGYPHCIHFHGYLHLASWQSLMKASVAGWPSAPVAAPSHVGAGIRWSFDSLAGNLAILTILTLMR